MADGHREGVGGVVGLRRLGERQQRPTMRCTWSFAAERLPQTACFTACGVYEKHGPPAIPADSSTTPRPAHGKGAVDVAAEVQILHGERRGSWA